MTSKKCLKNIDITDAETITPFIEKCIQRHGSRRDFRRFFEMEGLDNGHRQFLNSSVGRYKLASMIAKKIAAMIKYRRIPPLRVWAKERYDSSSNKLRLIGNETVLQRLLDYIAVYGCSELWNRKLVQQQCSSIPGRGQFYGMRLLRHYIVKDNRAAAYATKHHIRYSRKCRYFAKLDIRHCYESIDKNILMRQFMHDIGNPDMLYLWQTLLDSYKTVTSGLLIGALPSQFASQYIIVNLYRRAMASGTVAHMVTYMDDLCLFAPNRRKLLRVVRDLITYAKEELHLVIKADFAIKKLADEPIDMMGFVLHSNGKVTIRAKGFIHARRLVSRYQNHGCMTYSQAKRLVSYKGYFLHTNCTNILSDCAKAFRHAQKIVSYHERIKENGMGHFDSKTE